VVGPLGPIGACAVGVPSKSEVARVQNEQVLDEVVRARAPIRPES